MEVVLFSPFPLTTSVFITNGEIEARYGELSANLFKSATLIEFLEE